ncbi:hypothetical protein [Gulosibacter sp. 10]|uniref:hypothetical protein n=1 Tax=Gulosibacter sp. 10 TaxID=1255570 RepID=UPI00097F2557|nr:hypothetical protein [Gulosibacter sp. 10]SJM68100.1 hypothetical protein FM112_13140 [Gulosibacter sp. 10]
MSESDRNELDPNARWYQRGGFTTIAAIAAVLGVACWVAIGLGAIFSEFELVRGFLPYPAVVGLLFGILGALGSWRVLAVVGAVLNLGALVMGAFL